MPAKQEVERDCNTCRHHQQGVVPGTSLLSHTSSIVSNPIAYWNCERCLNDRALPHWEPLK